MLSTFELWMTLRSDVFWLADWSVNQVSDAFSYSWTKLLGVDSIRLIPHRHMSSVAKNTVCTEKNVADSEKVPSITGDCTAKPIRLLRETLLVDWVFPVPMYRCTAPRSRRHLLDDSSWEIVDVLVTAWSKFCFREGLFQLSASSNLCFQQMMITYVIALLELKSKGPGILAEIQQF